jgi:simple sugar transport system ATP-binding protein
MTTTAPAIRMTGIAKRFGAVQANRDASIVVAEGEIHALMGENGAGKSTLMKMLAGLQPPDAGQMQVRGRDVTGWTTNQAIAAGVGMVHQHFMLVPTLTVAENVVLGREPTAGVALDMARATAEVERLCAASGLQVPAGKLVSELSVGEAQRVEILKVLYRGAQILLLDEPTAVLSPPEVRELWQVLRRLRDHGATIVLVTHKLDEVMDLTDRITVMRQGATVAELVTRETTAEGLAQAMVGRPVDLSVQLAASKPVGEPILTVQGLTVRGAAGTVAVQGIEFAVHAGEILGIAGVEGNGQTELLEALAGLRPAQGSAQLRGQELQGLSVRERGDAGLSHVPEDRHRRGLVLDFPVLDNLILGQQHRFTQRGVIDRAAQLQHATDLIAHFDIRPTDPMVAVRGLSGGNQQKVVMARELARPFHLLLAAQPTRGVDVGAIEFIHAQLRAARDAGKAVLLVSAELREVLTLADRVAVMYGGRIVTVLPRAECNEEVLGPWMTGARKAGASPTAHGNNHSAEVSA